MSPDCGSAPRRGDAQPVPVRVFEVALATSKAFLVNGHAELRGDGINVAHIQMDEAATRRVTRVFGQVEANIASRDRNEPGETGFELVIPFLVEAEAVVPLNRSRGVRDTKNWHNPFVHAESLGDPKNSCLACPRVPECT